VDLGHDGGSLAHRCRDAFSGSRPHITYRENSGPTGLQRKRGLTASGERAAWRRLPSVRYLKGRIRHFLACRRNLNKFVTSRVGARDSLPRINGARALLRRREGDWQA